MLINPNNMQVEVRENMRGGSGEVKLKHIIKKDGLPSGCRLFAEIELDPGCSIGFHRHQNETEIYYFLEGQGIVDDDGVQRQVSPGFVMSTGGGKGHAVENTGDKPLKFMAVIILE